MKNKKQLLNEIILRETKKILEEIKRKKKKPKLEGLSVSGLGLCETDEVGTFYVAMNAGQGITKENIVFETDAFNLAEKINSGAIDPKNIKGMFKKESAARKLGNKMLQEREAAILAAKNKAETARNIKGEILNKTNEFKKIKSEAEQAAAKLKENEVQKTSLDGKLSKKDIKSIKSKAAEMDKKKKPKNELLKLVDDPKNADKEPTKKGNQLDKVIKKHYAQHYQKRKGNENPSKGK